MLKVIDDFSLSDKEILSLMLELSEWERGIYNYLSEHEKTEEWSRYQEILPHVPEYLKLMLFLKCIYTQHDNLTEEQYAYFLELCANEPEESKKIRKHLLNNVEYKFPGEYITIYRGEHGLSDTEIGHEHTASRDINHGISWTYEPSVAGFFAVRTQSDDCRVYTAKVHKNDVLIIFDERTEAEVIIKPMCIGTRLEDLEEKRIQSNISVMREFYDYRDNEHKKYEAYGENML